jgi:hypothetical protein
VIKLKRTNDIVSLEAIYTARCVEGDGRITCQQIQWKLLDVAATT